MSTESRPVSIITHLWREQVDLLLILFTVCLFYFAFPSGGYAHLAWFAIIPVLLALPNATSKQSFYLGFLAALFGWMASIWWSVDGVAQISQHHPSMVLPVIFIFCMVCALPYGISSWVACRFNWLNSINGVVKLTALLTILVNFIPQILPGNLAHSLYLSPEFIQLASVGGVPLVFFIVHLVNVFLAVALLHIKSNQRLAVQAFLIALGIFLFNWGFGVASLSLQEETTASIETESFHVGYVQPNFSVHQRTRVDWPIAEQRFSHMITGLEQQALVDDSRLDLIVLPEVPVPISYQNYKVDQQTINRWSKTADVLYAGIGFNEQIQDIELAQQYFNAVEYVSDAQLIATYNKQRLIPFAEYLPMEASWPWMRTLFPNTSKYQAGSDTANIEIKLDDKTVNVVPLICYESVFSDLVGDGVAAGGELLINVVNDGWFADEAGHNVHLALALFRAVEYRKPLLRVTNNGISGFVSAQGIIDESSVIATGEKGINVLNIELKKQTSFYARYPYVFACFCFLLLLIPRKRTE